MTKPIASSETQTELDGERIEQTCGLRLKRLGQYISINSVVAVGFAGYFCFFHANATAVLTCLIMCCVSIIHYAALTYRPTARPMIAGCYLASSILVIPFFSNVTGQQFVLAQYFFPVLCLIASQLYGSKIAARWFLVITIASFFCYFPVFYGLAESAFKMNAALDQMMINLAISFSVLWLSDQSEQFLAERSSEFTRLTDSLKESTRLLQLAEETAGVGHWRWNLEDGTFEFSGELKRILGCGDADLPSFGSLLTRFVEDDSVVMREAMVAARTEGRSFECSLTMKEVVNDVEYVTARGFSELDEHGQVTAVFGVIRDDTAYKKATKRLARKAKDLKKLASYDPLTGLANRFLFRKHLHQVVKKSVETGQLAALLVLDMDGFKEINDTLGHPMGDLVLREAAKRIRRVVGRKNVVARLGGDEFTVILRSPESVDAVKETGRKIVAEILKPMRLESAELHVGASIGASICPHDSTTSDELFTFADTAMYEAKFNDQDIAIYESRMTQELIERKKVESKLSQALQRDEFHLVYQPQVNMESQRISGFEALVRWTQDGEAISPSEFIPLLENSGKIVEVGNWIIEQACEQASRWYRMGFQFTMAVNISSAQFKEDGFVQSVIETIESKDIPPGFIDIEITETMLISDVNETSKKLQRLQDFGVKISVDDFGTGYSSLAYLKDFPIDCLKIDRAFIKDYPLHDDGMIATSIIVLGQSLDLEVLAEGVETEEQLNFLRRHHCNAYQGHVFSPPAEPARCETMLLDQSKGKLAKAWN